MNLVKRLYRYQVRLSSAQLTDKNTPFLKKKKSHYCDLRVSGAVL